MQPEIILWPGVEYFTILNMELKMADSIGTAAGAVWNFLNTNGASSATKIAKDTSLDAKSVQRAIGWLANEGKLTLETKGRTETIALK